jgi:hypothetical protein
VGITRYLKDWDGKYMEKWGLQGTWRIGMVNIWKSGDYKVLEGLGW